MQYACTCGGIIRGCNMSAGWGGIIRGCNISAGWGGILRQCNNRAFYATYSGILRRLNMPLVSRPKYSAMKLDVIELAFSCKCIYFQFS